MHARFWARATPLSTIRRHRVVAIIVAVSATFPLLMKLFGSNLSVREWYIAALLFFGSLVVGVSLDGLQRERQLIADISAQKTTADQLLLHATALTSAANGIVITSSDGTIEWVNPAFTHITGFDFEEVKGKNPRLLRSGKHDNSFYREMWTTISRGAVWRGEVTNQRKDGTLYIEEMTITPVVSSGGKITHYIAVKNDVTARKRAEEALARAEQEYRSIFDNAIIGIFRCTPTGQFFMMNPAMARMFRYDLPSEAIEQINKGAFLDGNADLSQELLAKAASSTASDFERAFRRRDGTELWLSIHLVCISNENGAAAYYEGAAEDITARKVAESALQESEEQLRLFVEHAPAALAMFDREMRYLRVSRHYLSDYGLEDRDLRGVSHYEVFPGLPELWKEAHRRGLAGEIVGEDNDRFTRNDGVEQSVRWEVRPWYNTKGEIGGIVLFTEDITERKLLESQLRQAQKMEAVGRLAGGVAHDFNNMLGVITGYSELLKLNHRFDEETISRIDQIHEAARKAASLTQQLLAFSRKQITQPRVLDLNEVASKLDGMLRRLMGEDIEIIMRLSQVQALAKLDPNQIDQVIMNLAVNARDAMPHGGKLIIETDTCELDASYSIKHTPVAPGMYVRLTLTDTGTGMDQETMSHLFEPFFTTKELGRGTGLGLSIVYGIVKQSQGYIWVYSEPGQGTAFKIYFPLQSGQAEPAPKTPDIQNVNGTETILVVEDDHALRSMEMASLGELGYRVLEAENGKEALERAETANSRVEVLITDLFLPGMGGRELADLMRSRYPNLGVIYTSGYTHDRLFQNRVLKNDEAFLQKPFALSELGKKLREVLREHKAPAPGSKTCYSKSASQ